MSRKKRLTDKNIQEILENDLSSLESDSDDDMGYISNLINDHDYDNQVLRGLSKILSSEVDEEQCSDTGDDVLASDNIATTYDSSHNASDAVEHAKKKCVEALDGSSDDILELVNYVTMEIEEIPRPHTPYNDTLTPVATSSPIGTTRPQPCEETPRVIVVENEITNVVPSSVSVPTQMQSPLINVCRTEDIDLRIFSQIQQAEEWSSDLPAHHIPKFDRPVAFKNLLSFTHKTQPVTFFDHFFPEDVCELIVEQTNIYAVQHNTLHWVPTNKVEIRAFLGVLILMGLNPLPDCNLYWSSDPFYRNPDISEAFTCKRFKKLIENVHLNDNSQEPRRQSPDHDKLYKIRPMIQALNTVFQNNSTQSSNQSVDECMVKFKGKSSLKQYMPKKPIKRGYKVWARCDAKTGYIYQFDIYIGKADEAASTEDGLGYNVVMKLCEGVPPNTLVAFDNFFTGVPLMLDLLIKKGIYAVGTVRLNRKGLPSKFIAKNKPKKEKLARHEFTYQSKTPVSIVQWMDTQLVNVLTTAHNPKSLSTVNRTQKDGTKKVVPIPTAIAEYTINMGGVDHFDHFRSSYAIGRKSRRTWMRLFYFMFDAAVINSYLTYLQVHKQNVHSHREYRLRLGRGLIDGFTTKKKVSATYINKKGGVFGVPDEIRLNGMQHYPEDQKKFSRCRFCSTKKQQKRDVCKVALCATPCFKTFHCASTGGMSTPHESRDSIASSSSMGQW